MKTSDIQIRDPFVLPDKEDGTYYLFGTTDINAWTGAGEGFNCYKSSDLHEWQGPIAAFRPPPAFWGTRNFWAPEVHFYNGRYYMFASFKADCHYRGTQILVSDKVSGPFSPLTSSPITPPDWECLDGTLYVASDGTPWIVFCHEWVQVHNGAIFAMPLSQDLKESVSPPFSCSMHRRRVGCGSQVGPLMMQGISSLPTSQMVPFSIALPAVF